MLPVAMQLFALETVMVIVLFLSDWLKGQLLTLFTASFILLVPMYLTILGFGFVKWFSVAPVFEGFNILRTCGAGVLAAYVGGFGIVCAGMLRGLLRMKAE